jgi:tRNA pseudouridine38-40 synthase
MARYQVILAYDGTDYLGFQRQASGSPGRTVQGDVEKALRRLGWQDKAIMAAGRTDTGVHATGQVIAFDLEWAHSPAALQAALNANLPQAVAARSVSPVAPDFHPRYAARARCYRYRLFCQPVRDPLVERYAWRVWPALQVGALTQAAVWLSGEHDFAAFGPPPRTGGSSVRTVFRAGWQEADAELVFEISANAFLFRMVRRLVGLQVQIGQGLLPVERMRQVLEQPPAEQVQALAPAHGLTLVKVLYEESQGINKQDNGQIRSGF